MVFQEGLVPADTQQYHLARMIPECWGESISDVLEMSRRCLEAICILRYPVRENVEHTVLPIDFPDFTKYESHFPPVDLHVLMPLQPHY